MTNQSLLARLDNASPRADDIRRTPSVHLVEQSIVENLRRLLQSRQGNSQSAPRCGVPDFSDLFMTHSNPTNRLCGFIKDMIEEFEPRLQAVAVTQLPELSPGALRFDIVGQMKAGRNNVVPFRVETVMSRVDHFSIGMS